MVVRSNRLALGVALAAAVPLGCGSSSHNASDGGLAPDASIMTDGGSVPDGPPPGSLEFFSSFEAGEQPVAATDTVEVDSLGVRRTAGVTGSPSTLILGNIMRQIAGVTAAGTSPSQETPPKVADGDLTTKWLVFARTGAVQIQLATPVAVKRYAVSSANDVPGRDPANWTLEGSQDGQGWTAIDTRTGEMFGDRFETHRYDFENATAYLYYRLNVTATRDPGLNILQIAELQLSDGDNTPLPVTDMKSGVGPGPGGSHNAMLSRGFTGMQAFRFSGGVLASGRGYSYNKIFDVDIPVVATSELSYKIFVDETPNDLRYPSTYAALDLAFDDGSYLSALAATDQQHAGLDPTSQGASRTLYAGEWNEKSSRIGAVAAGKRIKRILVGYDQPDGPIALFGGWIDDVRITAQPAAAPAHVSDHVSTLRGTHSSGGYSRGNNFPATAVPHGFNFWTPVTDAGSDSWLYEYHRRNDAQNRPMLQALSLSHEPSPWMGDRQSFQIMPSGAAGTPNADRVARALPFQHANEIARPYYYGVTFEGGIRAELTPTDHAAMFRFTFPGDDASLIFDNFDDGDDDAGGLTLSPGTASLTGFSDARSGLSAGATRIFIYATFDKPIAASGMLDRGARSPVTGYMRFTPGADRTVTMRIATSLISVAQAQKNLELEIAPTDSFDAIRARAQEVWDKALGIIEIEGANPDELTTLYSNLYRLFLYPNSGFENTGTAEAPVYKYASPVSGGVIKDGKVYVNNGFWDTYRATWPAYALLSPGTAGEMIQGFAQQFLDGGWIARWSSPGYADLMTGTSSDVAFADAYVKGVTGFDAQAVYDAAVRNATVRPPDGAVGRKGLASSIFLGYTPTESDGAAISWAMAGYVNDFGIANLAQALAAANPGDPRHQEYAENATYFLNRAQNYVHVFDPAIGFFQGKTTAGAFERAPDDYDPRDWGFGYTETDGWNTAFDPTHDGRGLANLYGGRDQLAAKLDTFFATPETGKFPGGYGGTIHEMIEARDVRMGQLGLSNQVSYHIIYMYDHAGQPYQTQRLVRDALGRLFVGSGIGQGYLGDDDNGASSAWQLFGALGFYPLQVGSASYVIGSPLFTKATVHLENGHDLVINAPNNSARNVYVQGLKLNGVRYTRTYLTHAQLAAGATLDFDMGPQPSSWGTAEADAPPSITTDNAIPRPLADTASGGMPSTSDGTDPAALFDNTSDTRATFTGANPSVQYRYAAGSKRVTFYTLTSGDGAAATDPTGWTLSGSTDGTSWTAIDQRSAQSFRWRLQTRAFQVATPGDYAFYRLELTGAAGISLAEIELLAKP
jgi:predicted alpha-1,2-mannosidase